MFCVRGVEMYKQVFAPSLGACHLGTVEFGGGVRKPSLRGAYLDFLTRESGFDIRGESVYDVAFGHSTHILTLRKRLGKMNYMSA